MLFTHVAFSTIVLGSDFGDPPQGIWSILAAGQVGAIGPFFILSGMLLYRPFVRAELLGTPHPALGPFFIRRMARLLPAFWVLVIFCLLVLNYSSIDGVWSVLRPFLLLHYYDPGFYAGLDVTWTVPTEMQFYLVLPLLAWFMARLARGTDDPRAKARRMMWPLGLLVAAQFGWTAYIHSQLDPWPPEYFYPLSISGLFAIGMFFAILSVLREATGEPPALFRAAIKHPNLFWLGALGAYVVTTIQPFSIAGTADWLSPEAALVRHVALLGFSFCVMLPLIVPEVRSRLIDRTLSNAPMQFMGRISYGIYLWHFAVMYLVFNSGSIFGEPAVPVNFLLGELGFWELMIPVLFGTIVVATISFYAVEQPILKLGERFIARRWGSSLSAASSGSQLQAWFGLGTRKSGEESDPPSSPTAGPQSTPTPGPDQPGPDQPGPR